MPKRTYIGPIDRIVIRLDGAEVVVARGESVEVTASQAKALDAQPANWSKNKKENE